MIVLSILKVIGWILLALLGILLLLIFLVLFVPVRYSFELDKPEELKIKLGLRATWLLSLLRLKLSAVNLNADYSLKLAWFTLADSREPEEDAVPAKPDTPAKKEEQEPAAAVAESQESLPESEPEESTEMIEETMQESLPEEAEEDVEESPPYQKRVRRRNIIETYLDKLADIIVKICGFLADPGVIFEKIKEPFSIIERTSDRLKGHPVKAYLQIGLGVLKKLLYHIRPRTLTGSVQYSLGDGYETGKATGYVSMLYPLYGKNLTVTPRFDLDDKLLQGHLEGRGRIRLAYLLYLLLILLWKKETRRLIIMALKGEL